MLLGILCVISALVVALMCRLGTLDHPVERSSHTRPTPKGGGVGIVACFAAGMALAPWHIRGDGIFTAACLFVALASYLDDVRQWPFWPKLIAQAAVSIAVIAAGMAPSEVAVPGVGAVPLAVLAAPAAMIWLLFTINAVNFMDGLNGLAAGCAAVGCLVLACSTDGASGWPERLIVAGVVGFLPFNYPRARIFMGDVGSQFLGLAMAALALRHAGDRHLAWILPLSLAPMLMDVAFTLCRRLAAGATLTQAHRGHLYQLAQRAGVPAWLISVIYWVMSGWGGWCGMRWQADQHAAWLAAAILPFPLWGFYAVLKARKAGLAF
jgi:UDP-GlcNAc:undecaprenyl-phosphate GlcNAc-1-phosphate transferase